MESTEDYYAKVLVNKDFYGKFGVLSTIKMEKNLTTPQFVTDDTLILYSEIEASPAWHAVHYHRRFPEWWWGHFYRPEVWASIMLGIVLIVRAFRFRRRKALGTAQQ